MGGNTKKISRATSYVSNDEYAVGLIEINRYSPIHFEQRRIQIITVVRDGDEAEFTKDLGKADSNNLIAIPSYMEHTVGELMDMALKSNEPPHDLKELVEVNRLKN